ncbi:MAG: hypothetical protein DIKNOCCD_00528 [bacterium]|nr:hypothetical protein [bacterium]MBV6480820.1 hypothetical protein [bacterium]MCE7909903.1 hypothetical protein [Candidatus Omnitrophica bacterium COP1]
MESRETFSPPPRAALIFLVPGILAVLFFLDGFCSFTRIGVWLAGAALAGMSGICLLWKRSRSLIINLAVLLTTLLFMAWIIEGVFRYALLSPKVPVDSGGFAKWVSSSWPQPIPREKPDGMFRTIGLSDSYGVAAEKNNYHCQLAQLLNQPNHPFEVVNFSVTGYQPLDQLRILETFGPSFHPDLVLHGFFVGNDFFARRGELVDLMGFPLLNFPLQELLLPRRFLLFQYAKASLALFRDNSRKKAQQTSGHPVGTFSQEEHLRVAINYFQACLKGAPERMNWASTWDILHQISDNCRSMGAAYALVLFPDQSQVDDALRTHVIQKAGIPEDRILLDQPQKFLLEECRKASIPCLDLLPVLKATGLQGELYYLNDTHLNLEGNRVAAEAIADFLLQQPEFSAFADSKNPQQSDTSPVIQPLEDALPVGQGEKHR